MAAWHRWWHRIALALLLLTGAAAQAQPSQPRLPGFTGPVVDAADVLPPETEAALTAKLLALQKDTNRQLVIATIADMQGYDLASYGNALIRGWGVGLKGVDNGAILFIAPNEPAGQRGPRIEVGYGLEPYLTDALSSVIINQDMMPRLKAGDVPGAMTAGADAIIAQLRANPDEAKARTDAAVAEFNRTHARSTGRTGGGVPFGLIFWGVIILFVLIPMFRGRRRAGPWGTRYRGHDGGVLPVVLWSIASELSRGGGGGSWGGGGGGSDGGGWGGGGFGGGGGGSGGGGGASGSW